MPLGRARAPTPTAASGSWSSTRTTTPTSARVLVEAGEADGGMVEVVAVEDGALSAGDLVVVG